MKLLVDGKIMATVFSGSKTVLVLIFYWHRHTKSFLRYWSKTTSHRIKTYRYICTKFKPNTGTRPVHGLDCYARSEERRVGEEGRSEWAAGGEDRRQWRSSDV